MKTLFILVALFCCLSVSAQSEKPLRVFIRAGAKTHGPDQHDHPRFLKEWVPLLNERGAKADGSMNFPTAGQLADTDVLVLYAPDAGDIPPEQRATLEQFLKRGGGIVVIHDGVCGHDAQWFKTIVGGAWDYGHAKYFEGDISFYYQDHSHPITRDVSNFDFDDEMYWDLDLMPEAHILAGTYQPDDRNKQNGRAMPSIYDIAPQMWTYEKDNYRAFVSIPGHNYKSFNLPHYRVVLLRGIAWAGKRDADLLVTKEELTALRYPVGGPTAPEEAAKKIFLAPGFNLSLVASEPLIEKPISMDWDPKGRLWIAETPEYPYRKDRTREPYDRISILESSRNDGRMDKKTVFYDKLDLVTSLVFYKDGVIVSQAPEIIWLRDTKHTGKADERIVLYKGFGTFDTHAVLSNLRWGMDGWIYATVGYSKGDVYSGDGKKHFGKITDGVFRFKPDGSAIEQVSSKGGNTWGVDIAPDGEIFFSQANGNHVDHLVMPESALARGRVGNATSYKNIEDHNRSYPMMSWTKQAYQQIDWVGNFTATAGACIYDGGAWPDKYYYTYYISEPTINIVHQDFLTPNDVSYIASKDPERREQEFIASTDLWFRPIHQRVGPDGALYVLDFYNQAVVHNDTRGTRHDPDSNAALRPDRDHHFGRIWRVQHNEAKKLEIPDLASASPSELVKALEHPNEWVRMTALRLLVERNKTDVVAQLEKLAKSDKASAFARIHALWVLTNLGLKVQKEHQSLLALCINSSDPLLTKAALQMAAVWTAGNPEPDKDLLNALIFKLSPEQPRLNKNFGEEKNLRDQLFALLALQSCSLNTNYALGIILNYPTFSDAWLQSAFLGVASKNPYAFISEMFAMEDPANYRELATTLIDGIGKQNGGFSAEEVSTLISDLPSKPTRTDVLKQAVLEGIGGNLKAEQNSEWTPQLAKALGSLLASTNGEIATLALPIATTMDKKHELANKTSSVVTRILTQLNDPNQTDGDRAQMVRSLMAVRQQDPNVMPAVANILGSSASPLLQQHVIEILGRLPDSGVGDMLIGVYPKLSAELQDAALNQLFKRGDWSLALLDAIDAKKINLTTLGPVAINRLRTHSNADVAARANKIIDALRGPETKEKDALIAQFTPIVTQPGDAVRGKELFTKNCAVCHKFKGAGKDVAPDLTGMGAHGPAELIVHVLDPNREVEPNYYAYSVETKDGEIYDGVIARENSAGLTLRNAAGDTEIPITNIKTRRNRGVSLMPTGFESLGGETLRDILAYLCEGEANFRILDLRSAFTASSLKGLWLTEDNLYDTLDFKKFGLVKLGGVPFEIVNPMKSLIGKNLILLKGGNGRAQTYPRRVEVDNIGAKAARLHFLGGVAGWGYPLNDAQKELSVAKVTVNYADHQLEELVLKNGVEIADWNGSTDVPGSKSASELVKHGQVRWFTKELKHPGVIQSLTLESFNNGVSPAFVAITADTSTAAIADAQNSTPAPAEFKWRPGTKHVLIFGGGSSHDFNRWFNEADSATLNALGNVSVNYTEKPGDLVSTLKDVDLLVETSNQTIDAPVRKAIFDFANSGHGLVLVHPGLWYNWQDWPEYNRVLVGGGAHGHDKYGEFEVAVKQPDHLVMMGVPATFKVSDELYHSEIDPNGTPIEVLAEAHNLATGKTYPSVWIVKHPEARIVCIALGHDASSHDSVAYKTILQNAVKWAAK